MNDQQQEQVASPSASAEWWDTLSRHLKTVAMSAYRRGYRDARDGFTWPPNADPDATATAASGAEYYVSSGFDASDLRGYEKYEQLRSAERDAKEPTIAAVASSEGRGLGDDGMAASASDPARNPDAALHVSLRVAKLKAAINTLVVAARDGTGGIDSLYDEVERCIEQLRRAQPDAKEETQRSAPAGDGVSDAEVDRFERVFNAGTDKYLPSWPSVTAYPMAYRDALEDFVSRRKSAGLPHDFALLREAWEAWMASEEAPDADAASLTFALLATAIQDIAYPADREAGGQP